MFAALFGVAILVAVLFLWHEKNAIDDEMRARAFSAAKDLSAAAASDIMAGDRPEISRKIKHRFAATGDTSYARDLLYILVYNKNGELLFGGSGSDFIKPPSGERAAVAAEMPGSLLSRIQGPLIKRTSTGVYDVTAPVLDGSERIGFVRVGISGQQYAWHTASIAKYSVLALLCICLVGTVFSRIITFGITRPILQLSDAAEGLSQRNWDAPLPVKGRDEISRLGHAFNQMALTLKQREFSLSRGNKDLFILHSAGLDLMESLDRESLLVKIAARAEDLVRADTTSVAMVDNNARMLTYAGVYGPRAKALKGLEMPLETGGIYNWLACYGTPILIAEAQSDFRLDGELMKALGIKSCMSVPLWSSNMMTGVLTAVNKKDGTNFDKRDLRLFTVFSNLAGAALQNASLYADLTGKMNELRSAQEQLVHSTKMAAIGELAANVAHEVNNPLTSVLGYTTHLLKTLELPEPSRRVLGMMEQETLRVRKIIRSLLDFSRQKAPWIQPTDICLPLRETTTFLRRAADISSVKIFEEFNGSPVLVNIDANEMKQVFINIINNAIHAMPQGGSLRIRLSKVENREALIEFADTGVGISQENIKKIFEPFFSTKEQGDGTGLGLSISYRIMRSHGGRIEVESEVGAGSVFKVFLPLFKRTGSDA